MVETVTRLGLQLTSYSSSPPAQNDRVHHRFPREVFDVKLFSDSWI
jgi:hypothetical protein